jgi:hypothetical protein
MATAKSEIIEVLGLQPGETLDTKLGLQPGENLVSVFERIGRSQFHFMRDVTASQGKEGVIWSSESMSNTDYFLRVGGSNIDVYQAFGVPKDSSIELLGIQRINV